MAFRPAKVKITSETLSSREYKSARSRGFSLFYRPVEIFQTVQHITGGERSSSCFDKTVVRKLCISQRRCLLIIFLMVLGMRYF